MFDQMINDKKNLKKDTSVSINSISVLEAVVLAESNRIAASKSPSLFNRNKSNDIRQALESLKRYLTKSE